ncbi:MAG: diacylglycerol kinase [Roseiflexaceae bacterium]
MAHAAHADMLYYKGDDLLGGTCYVSEQPKRRARLLVNPSSGPQQGLAQLPLIMARLEAANIEALLSFTTPEQPPTIQAQRALTEGFDLVIVAGGDGTVSAVAQGLLTSHMPLGILPVGTYNNIARSLGIPGDLDRALDVVVAGRPWRIDAATANGIPFMEVAGVGLDARLFPIAEQMKSGKWYQAVQALRMLRSYRARKLRIEFSDGSQVTRRPLMALISNMPYFGVGFAVAPDALPDSGKLVLSIFENMTKLELLRHFLQIANGRRIREPRITTYQDIRFRITSTVRSTTPVQADGNMIGRLPTVFAIQPQVLTVLAPTL